MMNHGTPKHEAWTTSSDEEVSLNIQNHNMFSVEYRKVLKGSGINCQPQKPLLDDAVPDLRSELDPLLVLLMIPFPKYSAMTENPSLEFFT